jgi:LuxR family transcriptional regulator, maltose regulon positive regulatory protein
MPVADADGQRPGSGLRLVQRPALVELLERAAAGRVTVISAPPGSGKTYLLRAWRESTTRRVASAAVRRDERDAQRFWLSIVDAVHAALNPDATGAEPVAPSPEFDSETAVSRLVEELEQDGKPLVLVIDDLHELTAPEALAQLERLLDRLPPSMSLVISSRRDPSLRLHHLRLEGQLTEIRAPQLRFDAGEMGALLAGSGVQLADKDLALLHDRTEGWAAGLRLAAIALAGHPHPDAFLAAFSGSNRTVSEYLLAEVLDRQPEPVRRLLLRTSLLDRIPAPLADLLIDGTGSQEVFRDLEDANAFVISLGPERSWFRYHHLFGDLLRLELGRTAPGDVPELHRRASTWFAEHRHPLEAIGHAQRAGDWRRAARLLCDQALSLSLDGQASAVHVLLQAFPDGELRDDPELAVVFAADEQQRRSLDEAAAYLALAESAAEAVAPERRPRFDVLLAANRLSLARRRGDFRDVVEQVDSLARPTVLQSHADVALGVDLRAVAMMNLGIAEMWSLQLDAARQHLEDAAAIAARAGRPYLEVGCRAHLGFTVTGRSFAASRALHREAIALAERHGWEDDPVIAPAFAAYGGTLAFSGEFDAAERLLERGGRAIRPAIEPATALLLNLSRGMLLAGRGRALEAIEEFRAGEQMQALLVTQHGLAAQLRSFRIAMEVRAGLLDQAAGSLAPIAAESEPWGESLTAVATVQLAEERPQQALDALQPIFDGSAPVIHEFTTVEAHMLVARAAEALNDRPASERAVERALELAERERLVLPFAMASGIELLRRHPRHATAHAKLLTDIIDILDGGATPLAPAEPLDEPLSAGELKVLGYLPSNLSTPEIAGELYLSVNTVRTHIRHIYAKLAAHTRSEAVDRARSLGLLGGSPRS